MGVAAVDLRGSIKGIVSADLIKIDFARDIRLSVAPIVDEIGRPVISSDVIHALDDAGQIAIALVFTSIVIILSNQHHVITTGAATGGIAVGCSVIVGANECLDNISSYVENGASDRACGGDHLVLAVH